MKALYTSLPLLACVSLLGCGKDDDNGPAPYNSGVQEEGPVNKLDDADLQRLCRSYDAHVDVSLGYDALAHVLCLPQALLLGGSREGCQRRLEDCKRDLPPPARLTLNINDEHACVDNLRQCNASVVQLEGCVNVNIDWAYNIVQSITCGDVGNDQSRQVVNGVSGCGFSPGCDRFVEVQSETPLF